MTDEFLKEDVALANYALVGGPADLEPRIRRVAAACAQDARIRQWAITQAFDLFEGYPARNIEHDAVPEKELGDDIGAFNMMVALASVPLVAETHRRFALPPEHLAKTFSWFRFMIEHYRRHHGVPGITHTRTFWFRKHVDGLLFRFGNMEFLRGPCPDYVPAEFRATLGPDDEVPTFHFPGGPGGLDPAAIKASFAEAVAFWKRAFGHYPKAFACDSWLFIEQWQDLLPNSRIARSIDLYDRLPSLPYNAEEPSGLFFVFGKERCDPRDFPMTTALERAYVTLFERGIQPRDGCAWVKVSDEGEVLFADTERNFLL